ncbi:MAG: DUF1641 domain-containing protein [Desulfotalea sp.]
MDETVILKKLDGLSVDICEMKAEIIREIKDELRQEIREEIKQEMVKEEVLPNFSSVDSPKSVAQEIDTDQVKKTCQELLYNIEQLKEAGDVVRAGKEFAEDLEPIFQQFYPNAIKFCSQMEGEFVFDELSMVLRKVLTSLDAIGEGLDVLKAGVELRDEMVPIIQLAYPKILKALTSLHEGEFRAERLGDLFHNVLMNIQTLSDLLNIIQPITELVKEVGVMLQQTNVLPNLNQYLNQLHHGSSMLNIAKTMMQAVKKLDLNEERVEQICTAIGSVEMGNVKPVGVIGMAKHMRDPEVQEALGFMFMLLKMTGACLQTLDKTAKAE